MTTIDKNRVKKHFNKGLNSYTNEASVQKQIAKKLIRKFCELNNKPLNKIMEVGSGTGFLTQNIIERLQFDQLITNDICITSKQKISELEKVYQTNIDFVLGDAESIPIPTQLDALISGSTMQWFKDLPAFFEKSSASLNSNGYFAFSTFGCHNFKEVKTITGIGLDYLCLHELCTMLSKEFDILWSEEWTEVKTFASPFEVLRHMKQTGVNGISNKPFGKKSFNEFTQSYKAIYANEYENIPLTYHPIIIIAQKN